MLDINSLAQRLFELFKGRTDYHGKYVVLDEVSSSGKRKGVPKTVPEPVNVDRWIKHLTTDEGLGVIPINQDSQVVFGAIDIDDYKLDHKKLIETIEELKLPLIVCKSKSGGGHLYCFTKEPVAASLMIDKMKEWVSILGYSNKTEIFPKQRQLSQGDVGNWINMPYSNYTKTLRPALDGQANPMDLELFVDIAESKRISKKDLRSFSILSKAELFQDGPPCLQTIVSVNGGFGEGGRNKTMFNVGVYLKKKFPKTWEQELDNVNREKCLDGNGNVSPLNSMEMSTTINSLKNKDYTYTCKEDPICAYCNKDLCLQREHGVGNQAVPEIGNIRKVMTDPPIFYVDVDGATVSCSAEELLSQQKFKTRVLSCINRIFPSIKKETYENMIRDKVEGEKGLEIIPVPEDATPLGEIKERLVKYCIQKKGHDAWNMEVLLSNRPYFHKENGSYSVYFILTDFLENLDKKSFRGLPRNRVIDMLRTHCDATDVKKRIATVTKHCWKFTLDADTANMLDDSQIKGSFKRNDQI